MRGVRRSFAIGFVIALAIGAMLIAARPHVVERWALYLGPSQQTSASHLFLDPFPNAASCDVRVKVFAANFEHAFCKSRYELVLGTSTDAVLAADFDPSSPAAWFCLPRWATKLARR